jgi:hypothetical protein
VDAVALLATVFLRFACNLLDTRGGKAPLVSFGTTMRSSCHSTPTIRRNSMGSPFCVGFSIRILVIVVAFGCFDMAVLCVVVPFIFDCLPLRIHE